MSELLKLAERVEAAEGPGLGLFLEAFVAVFGPEPDSDYQPRREPNFSPEWSEWTRRNSRFRNLLQFKAWLEAATLLVPEGCAAMQDWHHLRDAPPGVLVYEAYVQQVADGKTLGGGDAATPALALVAAALRARAA